MFAAVFGKRNAAASGKIPVPLSGVRVEACACRREHAERFCRNGGAGVCRDWRAGTVAAQSAAIGLPPVQLRLLEASTLREEVRQICIAIRRLVTQQNYCYRDIAVICGDYTSYASCIEQEFAAFGIPVYLDQTRGVTLNPFIEYIKAHCRYG